MEAEHALEVFCGHGSPARSTKHEGRLEKIGGALSRASFRSWEIRECASVRKSIEPETGRPAETKKTMEMLHAYGDFVGLFESITTWAKSVFGPGLSQSAADKRCKQRT